MEDFNKIFRTIIGGISSFEFILATDVLSVPSFPSASVDFSEIVLKGNAAFKLGAADYNSLKLSVGQKSNAHGIYYTCQLSGFLPDVTQGSAFNFAQSNNKRYLVIATTHQGERILLGRAEDPLKFSYQLNAEVLGGRKGTQFTFTGQQLEMPVFIEKSTALSFSINSKGQLVQTGSNSETFIINADGMFVVSGPNEADYSINGNGQLEQA